MRLNQDELVSHSAQQLRSTGSKEAATHTRDPVIGSSIGTKYIRVKERVGNGVGGEKGGWGTGEWGKGQVGNGAGACPTTETLQASKWNTSNISKIVCYGMS